MLSLVALLAGPSSSRATLLPSNHQVEMTAEKPLTRAIPGCNTLAKHLKIMGLTVGILISQACDLPSSSAPDDPPAPTLGGAELVRLATETNPTILQANAATHVAEADLAAAQRGAWPSPTVGISFAREGSTSTPANFSPASTIWMGTLQIPIPTFARNQGAVARSRAQVRVADARRRATSVQFNSMVGTAARRVDAAAGRSRALETGVVSAFERSLAALRRSYEIGELGFLDVAQALERLWAAQEEALNVRGTYYDAFADLERLVGPLTNDHSILEDSPVAAPDEGYEP